MKSNNTVMNNRRRQVPQHVSEHTSHQLTVINDDETEIRAAVKVSVLDQSSSIHRADAGNDAAAMPMTIKIPLMDESETPRQLIIDPRNMFRQREHRRLFLHLPVKLERFDTQRLTTVELDTDNHLQRSAAPFDIDERDTIPMLVLKGISKQQGQTSPTMQSEISGAASNAAFVGIGTIVGYILKYGNNFLMQRGLGAASFGLYSIGMSIVTLLVSILTLGVDDAMIRYVSIYHSKKQQSLLRGLGMFCFVVAGGAGIVGALFMVVFAPFLASIRHTPEVVPVLQVMAPIVPLLCIQAVSFGGLQGFKEFKAPILWQRIFVPVLWFLLLAGTLLFVDTVISVSLVTVVSTIIIVVVGWYFLRRATSRAVGSAPKTYAVREWIGFAIPNFLTTIVDTVLDSVDTLLLTFFAIADAAIGQYNAAIKISGFIGMPLAILNTVFAPTIAELHHKGEKQRLEAMFKVVTKWSITFSLPIFVVASLFSMPLLTLSGDTFVAAWPLLIVFAIGGLVNVGTGPVGFMLLMTGHQKFSFLNSLTAITANIVLGILLTPRYGAMGTAISTGIATCIVNLMRLMQVFMVLKMQPYRLDTLKPVSAGIVSAVLTGSLLYLLSLTHWSMPLIPISLTLIPVFLALYVGLLALLKTDAEDKIVLDAIRKKIRRGKK